MFRNLVNISRNVSFWKNLWSNNVVFNKQNQMVRPSLIEIVKIRFYASDSYNNFKDKERQIKIINIEVMNESKYSNIFYKINSIFFSIFVNRLSIIMNWE